MAVIDKSKAAQQKSDTEEKDSKQSEGRVVDILQDKTLPAGEKRKHDVTEDAWEFSAPPPAGRYTVKLHPAKDAVTIYDTDRQGNAMNPIYSIAIEGEIVNSPNGEYDKVRVFPRVSTAVGRGKNISTAAGLIHKLGYKLPEEIEDRALAVLVMKALMKEPTCDVEIDWQGYSKEDKRVAYRGMHKFPQDSQGQPMHIVEYMTKAKQTEDIRASLEVVHWYGKGEASKTAAPAQAQQAKTQTLTLATDEEEEVAPVTPAKAKGATATAAQPIQPSIEDELEELEA